MKLAKILLVEDNRMDIELTLDAFSQARMKNNVEVVRNGQEAMDYLLGKGKYENRTEYPMPDIILLDLKMPGIDGHEVFRRVKSTPKIRRIPVIILTSSEEEGDLITSYDSGANSYLVKPVSFDGFLDVVKKFTDYWISLNIGAPEG